MRTRLIEAGLWHDSERGEPGGDISSAWSVLARLGCAGRYGGRTQDGLYEYVIVNPETGSLLTSGRGSSLPAAMCEAALAARVLTAAKLS